MVLSSTENAFGGPTLGIAVFSLGDRRAFDIGLRSLELQDRTIDEMVIVRQTGTARRTPEQPICSPLLTETIDVAWGNGRNAALERLRKHDVALMVPEGAALDPSALSGLVELFDRKPRLVAAMITSDRCVPRRAMPPDALALEPRRLTATLARRRSSRAPRYFTPTMMALAPKRVRLPRFESFANRSDWATARLFLDAAASAGDVMEIETEWFASIGDAPDRRGGYAQGEQCYDALYHLATAYPRYRALAAADLRRLLAEQLTALALQSDRKSTRAFLAGMIAGFQKKRALRRRLNRDIRQIG